MTGKSRHKKIAALILAAVFTVTSVAAASIPVFADTEETDEKIIRLAGANRYETGAIISLFTLDDDKAESIVIVNGKDFPDALSAAPFASSVGASVLMVNGPAGTFDASVVSEIERIDSNHNANVYIIGGESAVSKRVDEQFKANGYENVERIYGEDRYETAVRVARSIDDKQIAFIANGRNYPDALGAGSAASLYNGVILFTDKDTLPQATREYLEHIGFDIVVILGGESAVSKSVEDEIRELQDNVTRIYGANRYKTSYELAEVFFEKTDMVVVATGKGFADALAGGPFAAAYESPILLVNPSTNKLDAELKNYIKNSGAEYITVLGGTSAVNDNIYKELEKLVK